MKRLGKSASSSGSSPNDRKYQSKPFGSQPLLDSLLYSCVLCVQGFCACDGKSLKCAPLFGAQLINQNQDAFLEMLQEGDPADEGAEGGLSSAEAAADAAGVGAGGGVISLTGEEMAAVERVRAGAVLGVFPCSLPLIRIYYLELVSVQRFEV